MNIKLHTDHPVSDQSILIKIDIAGITQTLDLSKSCTLIDIDFDIENHNHNQEVLLHLSTNNIQITRHPLKIEKIVLDDYYQRKSFAYCGIPYYDSTFLEYCQHRDIFLDHTVTDSHILNFTGRLSFRFLWPFWRNLLSQ